MDEDSNRARKAHSRRLESFAVGARHWPADDPIISFGTSDLEEVITPHKDALVIQTTIVNYDIARVLVDSGSSINILVKEAFDWMQVDPAELQPLFALLFGFVGHEVKPPGLVNLLFFL